MDGEHRFRVFVAGNSWRARRVVQALHDLCAAHDLTDYEVDVVDLVEHPEEAERYGVLALPMVMRVDLNPAVRVIGDLRDAAVAADALGLSGGHGPGEPAGPQEARP